MPDKTAAGDKRQIYLKERLENDGYSVAVAGEISPEELSAFQKSAAPLLLLFPIPAGPYLTSAIKEILSENMIILGGNLPADFTDFCKDAGISYIDYMRSETIALKNAIATAEGIIAHAIFKTSKTLHGSKVLITGFGKCGEILAEKLSALHAEVSIQTRNPLAKAKAECYGYKLHNSEKYHIYDMIFNTAPATVITKDIINHLKSDVVIFDIASAPGGVDFSYCAEKGIHAALYPGLPGKIAPETSADIIYQAVKPKLKEICRQHRYE